MNLDWIEVYHPNQPEFQGGLSLWRTQIFDDSDDRENMTEEELLKVYVKNLKNLAEHRIYGEISGFRIIHLFGRKG